MKIKTYNKAIKHLATRRPPIEDLLDHQLGELEEFSRIPDTPDRKAFLKSLSATGMLSSLEKIVKPIKMESKVYVIQEISGTRQGTPKINIMGATKYGKFVFCLPEMSQIIFSPGPLIFKLRKILKDYTFDDYLLLTGDPAIIGVACSIVSDITNGKYKLLKWDKQERKYYPIEINLHEKGNKDE